MKKTRRDFIKQTGMAAAGIAAANALSPTRAFGGFLTERPVEMPQDVTEIDVGVDRRQIADADLAVDLDSLAREAVFHELDTRLSGKHRRMPGSTEPIHFGST